MAVKLSAVVRMPNCVASWSNLSWPGSHAQIDFASAPLLIKPPMMALAMLPAPMNAIVVIYVALYINLNVCSFAKNSGANTYQGAATFDGTWQIAGHTHRECINCFVL